jgi:hypothetical protein
VEEVSKPVTRSTSLVESEAEEVVIAPHPSSERGLVAGGLFRTSETFAKFQATFRNVVVTLTRTSDPSRTRVDIYGRDFNGQRTGIYAEYVGLHDDHLLPHIQVSHDAPIGPFDESWSFHVESAHDIYLKIYDTTECSEMDVISRNKNAARVWREFG